jgi:hypothetical protein
VRPAQKLQQVGLCQRPGRLPHIPG